MAKKRRRKTPVGRRPETKRRRKTSATRKVKTKSPRNRIATRTPGATPRRRTAAAPKAIARAPLPAEVAQPRDLAELKRNAQETVRALRAIEGEVSEADRPRYLEARALAREARDVLELAEFEQLVREQEQALPDLVQRTKRLAADLQRANDAVAAINIAAAGLELFGEVIRLFARA